MSFEPIVEQVACSFPGQRILAVDDEPMVLASVQLTLSQIGFEVDTAPSGSEALAILDRRCDFSAVVTDQRMPQMIGQELASEIKRRWSAMPVIMLTAFPPTDMPPSVDAFLLKPFSATYLCHAVSSVLSRCAKAHDPQIPFLS
jgi:DNA-binding response OmpR family regulator